MENKKTENKLKKENLDKVSGGFIDDDLNQRGEFAPYIAPPVYKCAKCGSTENVSKIDGNWICEKCYYSGPFEIVTSAPDNGL